MATVYLAVQETLDRHVALKVIATGANVDNIFRERFLKEAKVVARLSHPNIISIYDIGFVDQYQYIAMEYLRGGTLKQKIKERLSPREALSIARQIGTALDHAHCRGFVHRDIKPGNILFRDDGTPVLSDFGIVKALETATQVLATKGQEAGAVDSTVLLQDRMTQTGMSIGTPHYMSPEQAQGREDLGPGADLYSLGVVLYEMLTGKVPFDADNSIGVAIKHIQDKPKRLPPALTGYQGLLDKLLAKKPKDRYRNAASFVQAVDALLASPASKAKRNRPLWGAHVAKWGVIVAIILVAAFFLFRDKLAIFSLDDGRQQDHPVAIAENPGKPSEPPEAVQPPNRLPGEDFSREKQAPPDSTPSDVRQPQIVDGIDEAMRLLGQDMDSEDFRRGLAIVGDALRTDPENAATIAGVHFIEKRFINAANRHIDSKEYKEAATVLTEGVSHLPESKKLEALLHDTQVKLNSLSQNEKEIKQRLILAVDYIDRNQLSVPKGKNALELYREILRIDPGNQAAADGINLIGQKYVGLIKDEIQNDRYDRALGYLETAKELTPNLPGLTTLGQELEAERNNRSKQIDVLLARGFTLLNNSTDLLVKHPASDVFHNVLAFDPSNEEAQKGLTKIADMYLAKATAAFNKKSIDTATKLVTVGLTILPSYNQLVELRQRIGDFEKVQQDKSRLLLSRAKSQLQDLSFSYENISVDQMERKLRSPLSIFRQALELSPGNVEASNGLGQIASYYYQAAVRANNRGNLREAEALINKGFAVVPGHTQLARLGQLVIEKKRNRQSEINTLLIKGNKMLAAPAPLRWLEAVSAYVRVIQIARNNNDAQRGLN